MELFEIDAKLQWVNLTIARFKAFQISGELQNRTTARSVHLHSRPSGQEPGSQA